MAKRQTSNEIDKVISNENIIEKDVSSEMKNSYLTYAVMTIVDRALPDVRDGLKPVQRRIMYSMFKQNIKPNGSYKKSARIVGDVIGKYHPHGDTSCYGAMCNMINDFDIRYPMIDGHGNFGSVDGDGAAAMRYTEAKLLPSSMDMLNEIDDDGVEMVPNFSEDELEPEILPAKIPYLLANGTTGIATGYTTDIPSHNMNELCDAIIATIKNPDIQIPELVEKHIKGPDLPSYGYLIDDENILELYTTGKATLNFRGKVEIDVSEESGNKQVVITELPPGISKPTLLKKLHDIYITNKDKKVVDLRDESEGTEIRIVLELHKTGIPELIIDDLYENTPLKKTKSYILRAIVEQAPLLLNLKQIIEYYIEHRKSVVEKRTRYKLEKLRKRINILNGYTIIINDLKKVVEIIMDADSSNEAMDKLKNKYNLNDEQTKAIMDMQLRSLTKMEKDKISDELNKLLKEEQDCVDILNSSKRVGQIIIEELKYIKKVYGDERKTRIISPQQQPAKQIIEKVVDEPMFIGLTSKNQIKVMPYTVFEKMIKNKSLKEKSNIFKQGLKGSISDTFILILSDGNYIKCDFATLSSELSFINKDQKIVSIILYNDNEPEDNKECVILMSKKGFAKKMYIPSFKAKTLKITPVFNLQEGDELITCRFTIDNENNVITLTTQQGLIHRFCVTSFSATSQTAKPLGCMNISEDDEIVDFDVTDKNKDNMYKALMFNKHSNGMSLKVVSLEDFMIKNRMAKGAKAITYSKKDIGVTKNLVLVDSDFFLIGLNGEIILRRYNDISVQDKLAKPQSIDFDIITSKFLI